MKSEDKKGDIKGGGTENAATAAQDAPGAQPAPEAQNEAAPEETAEPLPAENDAADADTAQQDGADGASGQDAGIETGANGEVQSETEKLTMELEKANQLAADNYERAAVSYDKYVRFQAEVDNYKKRIQKERAEEGKYAHLPVMRDLMGILGNLERAVEHARNDSGESVEGILSGVEMVVKQLNETFERHGMKRIKSLGEQFDPTMHEAMGVVETEEVPENQVMAEYEPGYFLHDRVVKPAMVTVSKKPAQADPETDAPQE